MTPDSTLPTGFAIKMNSSSTAQTSNNNGLAKYLWPFRFLNVALGHIAVFVVVYWTAFLLRFDFNVPVEFWSVFLATMPWVLIAKVPVFFATSHFHSWSRHIAFSDLISLVGAALCSLACLGVVNCFATTYF